MDASSTKDFGSRLAAIAGEAEGVLEALLSDDPAAQEITRPPRLLAAMRHGALGGGKRLRPFLVVESAALFGVPRTGALHAGCALELIHCYSLVHDDLPAMDDDDLRRGRPTAHKAFDEIQKEMQAIAADIARDQKSPDSDYRAVIRNLKKQQLVGDAILPHYQQRLKQLEEIIHARNLVTLPDRLACRPTEGCLAWSRFGRCS